MVYLQNRSSIRMVKTLGLGRESSQTTRVHNHGLDADTQPPL